MLRKDVRVSRKRLVEFTCCCLSVSNTVFLQSDTMATFFTFENYLIINLAKRNLITNVHNYNMASLLVPWSYRLLYQYSLYYWGHLLVIWHSQLFGLFWPFKGNIWSRKYCNKHAKYHDDLFNMWPPETNYLFTTSCTTGQKPWLCSISVFSLCSLREFCTPLRI